MSSGFFQNSSAVFSPCRTWRYRLGRVWDKNRPKLAFIMLNPSTADERQNDPTISRCIYFAKRDGFGGLIVGNIYAFRSTNPNNLNFTDEAIGPDNNKHLWKISRECEKVIAAWGTFNRHSVNRGKEVAEFLNRELYCLGDLTKNGSPRHPLYCRNSIPFNLYWKPAA